MNAISTFLAEFWAPFIGATFGVSIVWLAKRSASGGYPLFIGPKAFPELSDFTKDRQKQLLHDANKEAFAGWGSFLPVVVFATMLATGVALGHTLPSFTALPNSMWLHAIFAVIFAGFGGWLVGRLGMVRIRPFLQKSIENETQCA
jgi:hypothetical protein